jgi:hypothetical protein
MGDQEPISRFGHVELDELPEDLQVRVGAIAERSGFVPNVLRAGGLQAHVQPPVPDPVGICRATLIE